MSELIHSLEARLHFSAGGIDPYFGTAGSIQIPQQKILVASDGRILTVATTEFNQIRVQRYSADGVLDPTFDVTVHPSTPYSPTPTSSPVALDARDRLFAAVAGGVVCILPSGKLDLTWGDHGVVGSPMNGRLEDIAIQRDGKVLVSGADIRHDEEAYDDSSAALIVRFTRTGKRDTTFGPRGVRYQVNYIPPFPDVTQFVNTDTIAIDSQERIIAKIHGDHDADYGTRETFTQTDSFSRLNADGASDSTLPKVRDRTIFSTAISFDTFSGENEGSSGRQVRTFAVDARDRLVIATTAGTIRSGNTDTPVQAGLLRTNADGSLDTSFGDDGFASDVFHDSIHGIETDQIVLDANGRIYVAGSISSEIDFPQRAVLRLLQDGTLDSTFGDGGRILIDADKTAILTRAGDGTMLMGLYRTGVGDAPLILSRIWTNDAPAATLQLRTITTASARSQILDVTYRDDGSIDLTSLDRRDLRVTGPGGYVAYAKFESVLVTENQDGRIIARYKLAAPGGSWDVLDNGEYSVRLMVGQVRDDDGNAAASRTLGRFIVRVNTARATSAVKASSLFAQQPIAEFHDRLAVFDLDELNTL